MELNLFLDYIGNCVRHISEDVDRLHSKQYNDSVVLDHLGSEVIMLESHQIFHPVKPTGNGRGRISVSEQLCKSDSE